MIAFIRARFPSTAASEVWSDAIANNWMDPTIPFSMAHYWKMSTFHQIDFSYFLFPPVVVDDPRRGNADDRQQLVRAVLNEVDRVSKPDWNLYDRCIIFFAQVTDLFGGGSHRTPSGHMISAAVFDLASGFDVVCQEVGHAFGLHHELGTWHYNNEGNYTNEYGCPYSVMSATANFSFNRAPDPRLPGVIGNTNPQWIIGPYLPTVHLYINQYRAVNPSGAFNHPHTVKYLPSTYEHTPANVRLIARDAAIAAWPNRRAVLAIVPPIVAGGDTYFLELRRVDRLYDGGISNASIIILATNFFTGNSAVSDPSTLRIRYVDRIDLEGVEGDMDYHSFSGRFVVRVTSIADDFGAVSLSISGGNSWQNFAVRLDNPVANRAPSGKGAWSTALVTPCSMFSEAEYSYRINTFETFQVLRARSSGYEKPHYAWYLENVLLNSATNPVALDVLCRVYDSHKIGSPKLHRVYCTFNIDSGKLELNTSGAFADISLRVRVVVSESSSEVMKNYYPDRSVFTNLHMDNLDIEWDQPYQDAFAECLKAVPNTNTRLHPDGPYRTPWIKWFEDYHRDDAFVVINGTTIPVSRSSPFYPVVENIALSQQDNLLLSGQIQRTIKQDVLMDIANVIQNELAKSAFNSSTSQQALLSSSEGSPNPHGISENEKLDSIRPEATDGSGTVGES